MIDVSVFLCVCRCVFICDALKCIKKPVISKYLLLCIILANCLFLSVCRPQMEHDVICWNISSFFSLYLPIDYCCCIHALHLHSIYLSSHIHRHLLRQIVQQSIALSCVICLHEHIKLSHESMQNNRHMNG